MLALRMGAGTHDRVKQLRAEANVAYNGGLGRLAGWHLPGGPVGPPARRGAMSNV